MESQTSPKSTGLPSLLDVAEEVEGVTRFEIVDDVEVSDTIDDDVVDVTVEVDVLVCTVEVDAVVAVVEVDVEDTAKVEVDSVVVDEDDVSDSSGSMYSQTK